MAQDKLRVLLTLRERTVEQARKALAVCVAAETAAMDAIRGVDSAIQHERAAADRSADTGPAKEMFAAWLVRARSRREAAVAALAKAEGRTGEARAALAAARAAVRVVEQLADDRDAAEQTTADARERHALDDIARERHRVRPKM
jgi:flagellar export protein FliJ